MRSPHTHHIKFCRWFSFWRRRPFVICNQLCLVSLTLMKDSRVQLNPRVFCVRDDLLVSVSNSADMPQDLTGIAINVDNFQEAYDYFIGKGFVDPRAGTVTDTSSSKATMLFAPSGFAVVISEHLKD